MEASKDMDRVIDVLMLAGTLLLESGSEIHRVEDTMIRIAHSQGIDDCNALAMPVAIFFSIENANITRMKRILRTNYNIEKVCDVNQISRQLVSGHINLEQAYQALIQLKQKSVPYTRSGSTYFQKQNAKEPCLKRRVPLESIGSDFLAIDWPHGRYPIPYVGHRHRQ